MALRETPQYRQGPPDEDREVLDQALDRLENRVPDRVSRVLRWLRDPKGKWVRIPLGLLLIPAAFLAILPVFGLWMLPLGLMLLALDVPFLRGPVGRSILWLEDKWTALRRRWKGR